eukprot:731729-Rhodomonas_salina.4
MFQDAAVFNQSLSEWDTSSAQTLSYMFSMDTAGANLFNDDISRWDMSAAVDLSGMFSDASLFNVDISRWDVSKVPVSRAPAPARSDPGFFLMHADHEADLAFDPCI